MGLASTDRGWRGLAGQGLCSLCQRTACSIGRGSLSVSLVCQTGWRQQHMLLSSTSALVKGWTSHPEEDICKPPTELCEGIPQGCSCSDNRKYISVVIHTCNNVYLWRSNGSFRRGLLFPLSPLSLSSFFFLVALGWDWMLWILLMLSSLDLASPVTAGLRFLLTCWCNSAWICKNHSNTMSLLPSTLCSRR